MIADGTVTKTNAPPKLRSDKRFYSIYLSTRQIAQPIVVAVTTKCESRWIGNVRENKTIHQNKVTVTYALY